MGEQEREGRCGDGMNESGRGRESGNGEGEEGRGRDESRRREANKGEGERVGEREGVAGRGGEEREGPGCLHRCTRIAELSLWSLGNQAFTGPPTTCEASSFPSVPFVGVPGFLAPQSLLGDTRRSGCKSGFS